ncbi:MAG TPA: imelysin family protein [Chitinophagaceae bacterium]|nr:imelysin family protein [Chitinophagaceae bacterium]
MIELSALLLTTFSILAIVACNKDGDKQEQTDPRVADRKALLVNVADNIIIPSFENTQSAVAAMKTAAENFTASPDAAKLQTLRQQWQTAYLAWQKTELFHFGPADNATLRNYFNIYPTDITLLNSHISSGTYDLEVLINNKVQGFPALDYLLNGLGNDDNSILAFYTVSADAAKWKKYLTDITSIMTAKLASVVTTWKSTYRQQFVDNTGTGAGSSFSALVNEYIMYFERFLRSGKYAIPAGAMSGTAAPEKVEVFYSKTLGTQMALTALQAAEDFFLGKSFSTGTTGPGLKSYLQSLNATALVTNIESQFGIIETKANALGSSIHQAILNDRPAVLALYDEFQKQVRYFKVDMVSAIGISITYTDNDGD